MSLHQSSFFFFNDTATTEIYTLSLHNALPISRSPWRAGGGRSGADAVDGAGRIAPGEAALPRPHVVGAEGRCLRSEEHTSELQSPCNLVCRLLLEKKKKMNLRAKRT